MKVKFSNTKWFLIVLLVVGVISITGCSSEVSYEPREVNPEIDACEICNMSIAHEDYATQLIEHDGTVHMYDDLGCMLEYVNQGDHAENVAAQYVRDYETLDWIDVEQAYYAYHTDFWTPMAYGFVTFSSEEKAKSYVETEGKGEVLDYNQMISQAPTSHTH